MVQKKYKFSIILPTRGRPRCVERLFESIIKTTDNISNLEIVMYIDEEDLPSYSISSSTLPIVKIIGKRENMGKVTNICYRASTGDYMVIMNDDVVFQTPHWDTLIFKKINVISDGIFLTYGNDLHKGKKAPSFPIVSRKFCELMDGVCPDNYIRFHIESHIFDIFKRLKRFGFDRIFYLHDIIFEHLHYLAGKSSPDETYLNRNNQIDELTFVLLSRERYYLALKLAHYVRNYVTQK